MRNSPAGPNAPAQETDAPANVAAGLDIGPLRVDETRAVAKLHAAFFEGAEHGHSIANLGEDFLEHVFYGLNFDNPYFFCDVARYDGGIVAFSVYTTDRRHLFRHTVRKKLFQLVAQLVRLVVRRPKAILSLLSNVRYVGGEKIPAGDGVAGWWLLLGVLPEFRGAAFVERTGIQLATSMAQRMEETMRAHGCSAWYAAPHPWNKAINRFLQARGGEAVGSDRAQGLDVVFYVKRLNAGARP